MREGLKQRLVGAVVLTALAVIFLPGVFKEQQAHQVDTRTLIPPPPQAEVIEFTAPDPGPEVESAPVPETMFLPDENAETLPATPPVKAADELPEVPKVTFNEQGIPEAWVVQVVSLSQQTTAMKLRDELLQLGYKAYIREVTTASGNFHRIFVGPQLDKAEAHAVKAELDQRLKVNAQVRRFEP